MTVFINARKKQITLIANGSETEMFALIVAFAGEAIISPKPSKSLFKAFAGKVFKRIVIDMSHENCSKEFIQMLLRMKSFKTI
jgi:hypothetical protein